MIIYQDAWSAFDRALPEAIVKMVPFVLTRAKACLQSLFRSKWQARSGDSLASIYFDNLPSQQESAVSMYFLDETDDWPEYEIIKEEIRRLDEKHVELQKELQGAESALLSDPANSELRSKADRLRNELEEIGKKLDDSLSMYR